MLWERVDALSARAPGVRELRLHGLHLVAARRLRLEGGALGLDLRLEQQLAAVRALCAPEMLARARDAIDGPVILVKGPEAAARWRPGTRGYVDLDLLVADSAAAQAALVAAGFREIGAPEVYAGIHHRRPLQWGDHPLTIELHHAPKWPDGLVAPPVAELLARAVPSATGVDGIGALDPAAHALVLAAHSWAHAPLQSLRHLIDVAAVRAEAGPAAIAGLARRWDCARLWATTATAVDAVLLGGPPTLATRTWGRYLEQARECTVLERHLRDSAAPFLALPPGVAASAAGAHWSAIVGPPDGETWTAKLQRTRRAMRHARVAQSVHDTSVAHPPRRVGRDDAA
jgi:hypothetical protein